MPVYVFLVSWFGVIGLRFFQTVQANEKCAGLEWLNNKFSADGAVTNGVRRAKFHGRGKLRLDAIKWSWRQANTTTVPAIKKHKKFFGFLAPQRRRQIAADLHIRTVKHFQALGRRGARAIQVHSFVGAFKKFPSDAIWIKLGARAKNGVAAVNFYLVVAATLESGGWRGSCGGGLRLLRRYGLRSCSGGCWRDDLYRLRSWSDFCFYGVVE